MTASQARSSGYGGSHLTYHLGTGHLERAGHGLYRVAGLPPHEHDDLIRLALWSRNREGLPQAVVSHGTALAFHGLCDLWPRRVHLTVPSGFRKRVPRGCVLHVGQVGPADRWDGTVFAVTTPERTLADVGADLTVTRKQLQLALAQHLDSVMTASVRGGFAGP